jgi:hypothetical protein
VQFASFFLVYL